MLAPKRAKHRKQFRGKMRGVSTRRSFIAFGSYALKSQEAGWVSARQIEAARRAMTFFISFSSTYGPFLLDLDITTLRVH